MSETKTETKKPTLNELHQQYSKLQRVYEGMPTNAATLRAQLKEEEDAKKQEMNAAAARAVKEPWAARSLATEEAAKRYEARVAKIKADFEEEIKPARQRCEALIEEAGLDRNSQLQSAKAGFNEAAEAIHREHVKELADIDKKMEEKRHQLEKQYGEQRQQVETELAMLKAQIDKLEEKKAKKEAPAEATA